MPLAGTQGTVSFVGNSPLLTGSFSGFDTAAIIEASIAVKRIPIDRLENKISVTDTRIAAFNEFKALLSTLQLFYFGTYLPHRDAAAVAGREEASAAGFADLVAAGRTELVTIRDILRRLVTAQVIRISSQIRGVSAPFLSIFQKCLNGYYRVAKLTFTRGKNKDQGT